MLNEPTWFFPQQQLQISIQKDSRPSEFSRPLTSITLNLNGDLPVDCRRVSLLELPNKVKKLSFLQLWGGEEMIPLLEQESKVTSTDSFEAAMLKVKIHLALREHVDDVYQKYKLFCGMQQLGQQTFVEKYPKVYEQAKMCDFIDYTAERAARDAMTIQTSDKN